MATYYLNSGAGGAATGADWTNAFLTYTAALAAATASGDIIKVHKTHTEELAVDTTYTHQNHISVICVDKDASDVPATMGTAAWIGNSTVNRGIVLSGAFRIFIYGITFRTAGSTTDNLRLAITDFQHIVYESCYLWNGNTSATGQINLSESGNSFIHLKNCTLRLGATGQDLVIEGGVAKLEGCTLSSAGSAPTTLFNLTGASTLEGQRLECIGCDFSHVTGTLLSNAATPTRASFSQCSFGSGYTLAATQTSAPNGSGLEAFVFDCAAGDSHGIFGYFNPFGSVISDTGIYFTSGAAAQSWKIVTTANCSIYTPFATPWFGYYNSTLSALTPYVEILRDGSATAYQDDEVWIDVMAKTTSGSAASSLTTDRMTILGTPANQAAGAGLGSWTGEAGTAWSGKCAVASLTPAEVGHISARIVVGEPSITVYADPQIRT